MNRKNGKELFKITRSDGRSNSQVVLDAVKDGDPGHIYTYDTLRKALQIGVERSFNTRDVQAAVRGALDMVARTYKRTLHAVPNVGYRLALAKEHMGLACLRQSKANRQIGKAMVVLKNVRWDEMDENTRAAHEGHLLLTTALYQNQAAMESRMRKIEESIKSIVTSR